MAEYFIGLMSGTSVDALDAVLVDFSGESPQLLATHSRAISTELQECILALTLPGDNEIERLGQVDVALGELSAEVVNELLSSSGVPASQVSAIGNHGQTIRHEPSVRLPFTLQIADPNIIAEQTGITTISDFRRRDMAAGGQGAPLVPAFHQALFHSPSANRVILNIGGIANISILPADPAIPASGFDTGPGNLLMDAWTRLYQNRCYDDNGNWARSGEVDSQLLFEWMSYSYFSKSPPKSTGREQFNLKWLEQRLHGKHRAEDIQASLCELTATSIAYAIGMHAPQTQEIYVCGGGTRNAYLMERLTTYHEQNCHVATTAELGVDPAWVEAMAFAWLARQTMKGLSGNLPAVTGARKEVILGGIYLGGKKLQA